MFIYIQTATSKYLYVGQQVYVYIPILHNIIIADVKCQCLFLCAFHLMTIFYYCSFSLFLFFTHNYLDLNGRKQKKKNIWKEKTNQCLVCPAGLDGITVEYYFKNIKKKEKTSTTIGNGSIHICVYYTARGRVVNHQMDILFVYIITIYYYSNFRHFSISFISSV